MKKKIAGIAMIAAIALGAGWNMLQSENEVSLSDLALSNVEALARGEAIPWDGYKTVYGPSKTCCVKDQYWQSCSAAGPC